MGRRVRGLGYNGLGFKRPGLQGLVEPVVFRALR